MIYMNIVNLWKHLNSQDRKRIAQEAGIALGYLRLLGYGKRQPSPALAHRLVELDNRLTLEAMRPDIWGDSKANTKTAEPV